MSPDLDEVQIYTDGGCDPNPGIGAWAAVLMCRGGRKEICGGELESTNNRMELTAAIKALEALRRPCAVTIRTDSEYLHKGMTEWLPDWKRRNWRRKGGGLRNMDLWRQLDELIGKHTVRWQWVKGHAGDALNERCDELVSQTIARLKQNQTYAGNPSGAF